MKKPFLNVEQIVSPTGRLLYEADSCNDTIERGMRYALRWSGSSTTSHRPRMYIFDTVLSSSHVAQDAHRLDPFDELSAEITSTVNDVIALVDVDTLTNLRNDGSREFRILLSPKKLAEPSDDAATEKNQKNDSCYVADYFHVSASRTI